MYKIIILEDEMNYATQLLEYLIHFQETHSEFTYIAKHYPSPIQFLEEYSCDADLLLLDIRLPGMTGMDVAHRIREMDQNVTILFITSLTQYAIEGYSVRAFDYIVKPVSYSFFASKLERVLRARKQEQTERYIEVKTKNKTIRIASNSILFIEILNHDITIHTDQGEVKHWGSLSKYEQLLKEVHFARCNSCYLVNLRYVEGVDDQYVQVGGQQLTMSKAKRKQFLMALGQYKGGGV